MLIRTTRTVPLMAAGEELQCRSHLIGSGLEQTLQAVQQVHQGETGMVEAGIAPAIMPVSLACLRTDTLEYLPLLNAEDMAAELMSADVSDNTNPVLVNFLAVLDQNRSS